MVPTPDDVPRRGCGCWLSIGLLASSLLLGLFLTMHPDAGRRLAWSFVPSRLSAGFHARFLEALGAEEAEDSGYEGMALLRFPPYEDMEEFRHRAMAVDGWEAIVLISPYSQSLELEGLRAAIGWRAALALEGQEGFPQDGIWIMHVFDRGALVDAAYASFADDTQFGTELVLRDR